MIELEDGKRYRVREAGLGVPPLTVELIPEAEHPGPFYFFQSRTYMPAGHPLYYGRKGEYWENRESMLDLVEEV